MGRIANVLVVWRTMLAMVMPMWPAQADPMVGLSIFIRARTGAATQQRHISTDG